MRSFKYLAILMIACLISSCWQNPSKNRRNNRQFYQSQNGSNSNYYHNNSNSNNRSPSSSDNYFEENSEVTASSGCNENNSNAKNYQFNYQGMMINFYLCSKGNGEITINFVSDDQGQRTCFIPTYKELDSSKSYYNKSFWVGNPICTNHQNNEELSGKLLGDRAGYQGYPLNSAMVMKENLLPIYFNCLNGQIPSQQREQNCNSLKESNGYKSINL
jgi:hypothetical protein